MKDITREILMICCISIPLGIIGGVLLIMLFEVLK